MSTANFANQYLEKTQVFFPTKSVNLLYLVLNSKSVINCQTLLMANDTTPWVLVQP